MHILSKVDGGILVIESKQNDDEVREFHWTTFIYKVNVLLLIVRWMKI
jgi:hypothetical protein